MTPNGALRLCLLRPSFLLAPVGKDEWNHLNSASTFESRSASESEPDLDLTSVIRVILRRRSLLLKCIAGALLLSVIFLLVSKRRYRADAELQLLSENGMLTQSADTSAGSDTAAQLAVTMETYVGVLTSDNLALRVIRELNLERTPEFRISPGLFSNTEAKGEQDLPLEETRFRREKVLRRFKSNLAVSAAAGSRLISVSFLSTDPELAKSVLNQLLSDFVDYNDNVRYAAAKDDEGWLSKQLVDLKTNVEQTQQRAAALQRQTGIYGAGSDASHDLVLARLEALNQELTGAEQNRIVKEAILREVQHSNPEAISNLSGNAGQAGSPGSVNALALIQSLRQQEATLSSQLAELSSKFGSKYPRVIETNVQLLAVRRDIDAESNRLTARAQSDYGAALAQENALRSQFDEQKQLAGHANDLSIQYLIANREALSSRDLYEHLLEKLKEVGIMAGIHDTNIDIIDHAHVGASPASPNTLLTLGSGLAGGLLLGICVIFLRDSLDRSIREPDSVRRITGKPLLGEIPLASSVNFFDSKDGSELELWKAAKLWPASAFTEAFRSVRTSLPRFLAGGKHKVILVTSASRAEGKTTVVFNLAGVLAQQGSRVLVIDADLRRRGLTTLLGLSSSEGLSNLLTAQSVTLESVIRTDGPLDVLPAGALVANPSELLSSSGIRSLLLTLRETYDYVLIDSVAVISLTDTVALSQTVDAVILVCRAAVTSSSTFQRAFNLLTESSVQILGVVFNAIDVKAPEYTYFSGQTKSQEIPAGIPVYEQGRNA